jgi:hypothetical protein
MFADSDDGEGLFDVPRIDKPGKTVTYICGGCCEKYVNEDEKYDPDLPEKEAYLDAGDRMAALAEDQSNQA